MESGQSYQCINLQAFFLGISIPHIILDLILIVMPIPHIWGLMIPSSRKAPILILFLLSALWVLGTFLALMLPSSCMMIPDSLIVNLTSWSSVLVASSTRLYYIIHFDAATFRSSWATDRSVLWSTLEHCFGIIGISMPSLRPILKSVYDHFKSTSEMTVATESNEPPPVMQRPRMGSVEYWKRLQFQSMSSRRPSDVLELEIDVAPPRRLSATEGALKETASRSISRDRQQAMQDSLRWGEKIETSQVTKCVEILAFNILLNLEDVYIVGCKMLVFSSRAIKNPNLIVYFHPDLLFASVVQPLITILTRIYPITQTATYLFRLSLS